MLFRTTIPNPDRIANAIAEQNRAAGRAQRLALEVTLVGEDGVVEAEGELLSDPAGYARLELRRRNGSLERYLLRGGRFGATRDLRRMGRARPLLPPLFLLQIDTEPALRGALRALGGDPDDVALGHTEREDCYVLGGRDVPRVRERGFFGRAPQQRSDRVSLWVDQESFEAVVIERGAGVRFRLGPTRDHAGLRVPTWIDIELRGDEPLRLEIHGPIPVDASAEAFDPSWLRSP